MIAPPLVSPLQVERAGLQLPGGKWLLRDLNHTFRAGQVCALVGPNGAGKSTLLRLLAADAAATEGTVWINGVPSTQVRVGELARTRAVQNQQNQVGFAYQARDLVAMARAPWQRTSNRQHDDAVVAAALEQAQVSEYSTRIYWSLSGGEQSRVMYARVLAQETAIILLDEPTAALDVRFQEELLAHVRTRAAAGATVVLVVHDLTLAAAYADEVVLLSQGRIRASGTASEVLTAPILTEVYGYPMETFERHGRLVVLPVRDGIAA